MLRSIYKFPREKFPALTGIRAIAAYLVFFHHYNPSAAVVSEPVSGFLREGHVGVTLFYVLSGFLITYNYSHKAEGLSSRFWFEYLSRRVARIYPLYLFLLALTFLLPALLWHEALPSFRLLFLNITLVKGFFAQFAFTGIAPSWSLTVEETFYLSAPLLFVLIRRYGYAAAQTLLYAIAVGLLLIGTHAACFGFFGNFRFVALYTFFGRSFEFLAGMALAGVLLRHPQLFRPPRRAALTYLGLVGFALVVFWMSLLERGEFGLYHPIGMVLNNFALPLFICTLFCGLLSEQSALGRVLSAPLLVFLGRSSYAFYLVHYGILAALAQRGLPVIHNDVWRIGLLFVAVNAISATVFLVVEHPANILVRRWADRLVKRVASDQSKEPVNRLRRFAIAWACAFAAVFVVWCVVTFDWHPTPAAASSPTQVVAANSLAQIAIPGIPRLGQPISAHTDVALITSHVGLVPRLVYKVAGMPIADKPFIFAHANSKLEYEISSESSLDFSTGLDDFGGADQGSVRYVVRGDGKLLFESPVVRALVPPHRYSVNLVGIRRLELSITDAGDSINSDEAYWIQPVLR